jgi:hypothetical protein
MRSPGSLETLAIVALLHVLAMGCASGDDGGGPALPPPVDGAVGDLDGVVVAPTDGIDGPFDGTCDPEVARVLSVRPWTGGGVQIALELRAGGSPIDGVDAVPMARVDPDGGLLAVAVGAGRVTSGLTVLLLVPSEDQATHEGALMVAHELVDALPEGERIALVVANSAGTLLADLTDRRPHLHERLDALTPRAAGVVAILEAQTRLSLEGVGGPWGPLSREVLLVDGGTSGPDLAAALAARRAATVLVGLCPAGGAPAQITLSVGETACTLAAPAADPDFASIPCDQAAAAADSWPWPDRIAFTLTESELATHGAYHAALDKTDFPLHVSLGDSAPILADAHFRGQSSLDCARKSYTVNLSGPEARRLAPGAANDEFYLISLCLDDAYFRQLFANAYYRKVGLFPLDYRLVELTINGESRGVYMLLEKPDETLPGDHLALEAVIRRRFDPEDKPEDVKFPADPVAAEAALSAYKEITALVETEPAGSLGGALDRRVDLDRHLLYLAFQTVMKNGDYVDEAYFYGLREGEDPDAPLYFRPMGWDSDDLFSVCHHQGKFETPDPNGVAYCVEGDLELSIYADEDVYERFADHVERLLTVDLTPEIVATRVGAVRDELFGVLSHDGACAAMVEVGAEDCAALHAHMEARMSDFLDKVAARNDELLDALAIWKAGQ